MSPNSRTGGINTCKPLFSWRSGTITKIYLLVNVPCLVNHWVVNLNNGSVPSLSNSIKVEKKVILKNTFQAEEYAIMVLEAHKLNNAFIFLLGKRTLNNKHREGKIKNKLKIKKGNDSKKRWRGWERRIQRHKASHLQPPLALALLPNFWTRWKIEWMTHTQGLLRQRHLNYTKRQTFYYLSLVWHDCSWKTRCQ